MNLDYVKVVYVVIDDDTRQRRGLYIDDKLEAVGIEGCRLAMAASYESGWSGLYERMYMNGLGAYLLCEEYMIMPVTLEELLDGGCLESGACIFPEELD